MVQARPEAGQISTIWGDWGSGRNGPSLLLCIGELLGWILEGARTARSYGDRTLFPTPVLRGPRTSRRGAIPITGVKRSAFGRLSGRQRPDADEVEGDEERQRRGNGAPASVSRTTGPLRGTRCASSFSVPYASAPGGIAGAACLRDIPCGNVVSRWTLGDTGAQTTRIRSNARPYGSSHQGKWQDCSWRRFENPTTSE